MKVVGFVPSKLNSQRLLRKNVRILAGRPLVNYCLSTLAMSGVDDTVVYASDPEILQYVEPGLPHRFVQRAEGYRYTIVAGTPTFVDGEHTGALPGRIVRS